MKTGKFAAYWANTSSNSLVGKLIREGSPDVKMTMELLLEGGTFHTEIDEQIVFSQLDYSQSAVWSLLLASGYLRVESCEMLSGYRWEYGLKLTNREVKLMFERMIDGWFRDYTPHSKRALQGRIYVFTIKARPCAAASLQCLSP